MKSIITATALAFCVIVLSSFKPVKVACIGDSITYGAFVDERETHCYPYVLQQLLGSDYEVRNYGFNARTMLDKGDYPYMKEKMWQEVQDFLPDVVTIMLGTNDSKPHNWKFGSEFESNYLTMVNTLKALPSHPKIFICLPPWVATDKYTINNATVLNDIIPIVKKVALNCWLDRVDTYSALEGHPEYYAKDGVHPNADGDVVLAKTIYDALSLRACTGKPGKRVMFIGDSITDGDWAKADGKKPVTRNVYDMNHVFGHGYTAFAATNLLMKYPEKNYIFFNRGVSGDRVKGLCARWDEDVLSVHPDIVSILIGANDAGSSFDAKAWEAGYREILDKTLSFDPSVRFVLCTPFVENIGYVKDSGVYQVKKAIVDTQCEIVRKLAAEYDAVLVPFDELIDGLVKNDKSGDAKYWVWDGIHPCYPAHLKMASLWIKKTAKLLK